jgi:O-acetyl-ADP-ribose deacetylase (regulator of RNase III)
MKEALEILKVGKVAFKAINGDIRDLQADALVQPSGTSSVGQPMQASPWVIVSDADGSITKALSVHQPFQLGDVIVTPAGALKAKYLFSAIVIDWAHQDPFAQLLSDKIVTSTARKCIEVALALGIKSIAFTPWGTRVRATEASHVTALLIQSIASVLQTRSGNLEIVYLISREYEHYQWFLDRAFVFQIMFDQVAQFHRAINDLNLPQDASERLVRLLSNLQNNVLSNVNIFLDKSQQINQSGGVSLQSEGDVNVDGDVTGRDKMSSSSQ